MSSPTNAVTAQAAETTTTETSLLDQIVAQGRFGKDTVAQERGKDMVKEFINQVLEGKMTLSRDAEASIGARIAEIDRLVSLQLNEVMHHQSFQKLEATWRGIKHLLDQSETSDMLKIKLLNVNKKDLLKDLQRAPEFDQSAFFKKVYEEEFGVFGGAPFAALVGDYEFGRGGEDVELLERVSQVASAAHAPFLSRGCAGDDEPERVRPVDRNSRYVEGVRQHRVCQVEELPRVGRFALRGSDHAACADARALRQRDQAD